ncbi:MAG TPA: hypothetical protein O0W90_04830, partial [Methanocorpusculum sp.]|nr:hypothetical protein [Methanocorpusculum sp.]
ETDAGREFLKSSLLKMATVNEYLSNGILSVFSHINQYSDVIKKDLLDILYELTAKVPEEKAPSVIRTAVTLIESAV